MADNNFTDKPKNQESSNIKDETKADNANKALLQGVAAYPSGMGVNLSNEFWTTMLNKHAPKEPEKVQVKQETLLYAKPPVSKVSDLDDDRFFTKPITAPVKSQTSLKDKLGNAINKLTHSIKGFFSSNSYSPTDTELKRDLREPTNVGPSSITFKDGEDSAPYYSKALVIGPSTYTLKDKLEIAYYKAKDKFGKHSDSTTKEANSDGDKGLFDSGTNLSYTNLVNGLKESNANQNENTRKDSEDSKVYDDINPYSTTKDLGLSDFTTPTKPNLVETPIYDKNGNKTHISVNGDLYAVVQKDKVSQDSSTDSPYVVSLKDVYESMKKDKVSKADDSKYYASSFDKEFWNVADTDSKKK